MKPTTTRPLHAALHGGVHLALRSALPLLLATALVACSGDANDAAAPAPIGSLDTQAVAAGSEGGARAWDGVVEAVREAALSAQTSGRVTEVLHDVNDRVDSGEVLVRLRAGDEALLCRVTLRSARVMDLRPGLRLHAVLKAVSVAQENVGGGG